MFEKSEKLCVGLEFLHYDLEGGVKVKCPFCGVTIYVWYAHNLSSYVIGFSEGTDCRHVTIVSGSNGTESGLSKALCFELNGTELRELLISINSMVEKELKDKFSEAEVKVFPLGPVMTRFKRQGDFRLSEVSLPMKVRLNVNGVEKEYSVSVPLKDFVENPSKVGKSIASALRKKFRRIQ